MSEESTAIEALTAAGAKFVNGQWLWPLYRADDKEPEYLPASEWQKARQAAADLLAKQEKMLKGAGEVANRYGLMLLQRMQLQPRIDETQQLLRDADKACWLAENHRVWNGVNTARKHISKATALLAELRLEGPDSSAQVELTFEEVKAASYIEREGCKFILDTRDGEGAVKVYLPDGTLLWTWRW